ncbi:MAG: hypothetical protein HY706_10365 [Candidatus Hydrogenedentes bacterium]|nr:hypothetical protein [Candidatus Hydrogenedentota bacterium]
MLKSVKPVIRFLLIALGLFLVLFALAGLLLMMQADAVLKARVEHTLSRVYGTKCSVARLEIRPWTGQFIAHNVEIANPAPFPEGTAVRLGHVSVHCDLLTLLSATPTVSEARVSDATVALRYQVGSGTNLLTLARRADELAGADSSTPLRRARRKWLIKDLRCENTTVNLSTNLIPMSSLELEVAPFTVNNVGDHRALTTAQIGAIFIRNLLNETVSVKGLLRPIVEALRNETDSAPTQDASLKPIEEHP